MSYGHELRLCDGPPCPRCGCQDVHILQQPSPGKSWWGGGRARCRHCGRVFCFREIQKPPPVFQPHENIGLGPVESHFPGNDFGAVDPPKEEKSLEIKVVAVAKCPDCGATMKISSTRKDYRHHKCPKCGKTTKTAR